MNSIWRRKGPRHSEDEERNDPAVGVATIGVSNGDGTSTDAPGAPTMVTVRANDGTSGSPSLLLHSCSGCCNLSRTDRALNNERGTAASAGVNEGSTGTTAGGIGLQQSSNGRAPAYANNRIVHSARLPTRAHTFPPAGHLELDILGNFNLTEWRTWTPDNSTVPEDSCCGCTVFPWAGRASSNDSEYSGHERFRLRELSDAEEYYLRRAANDPFLKKLSFSRVFKGPLDRLRNWPKFFKTMKGSGSELQNGFVTLWTTFIVAESLLASVAMQPFISTIDNLKGRQLEVYGLLWMLALVFDYTALAVTAIFLGYLHAGPAKLTYVWVCNIGAWIGVPGVLVLLGTSASLIAIAYSSWVIYGQRLGITCIVVEVFVVSFSIAVSNCLEKANRAVEALK